MRSLFTRYATELARPSTLDLLLPPSLPSLRDPKPPPLPPGVDRHRHPLVEERERMPAKQGPRDLFDMLLAARDPETGEGFSREMLCDQVATMILAGHETTALTLFWSLALLAQSPVWQQRVAEEAAANPFQPGDAAEILPRLVVTRAVVSEALRLYPPAFMITRRALARDTAGRTLVPRGATVVIAPWVLHRHTALWQDPHAFSPQRFMPDAPPPPALRLPAVRRRAAGLRGGPVRRGRSSARAGQADGVPVGQLGRHHARQTCRHGHNPPGPARAF